MQHVVTSVALLVLGWETKESQIQSGDEASDIFFWSWFQCGP